jgi:hypothetical protein
MKKRNAPSDFRVGDPVIFMRDTVYDVQGVVTRIGIQWVFVRFDREKTSIACHPERLVKQ